MRWLITKGYCTHGNQWCEVLDLISVTVIQHVSKTALKASVLLSVWFCFCGCRLQLLSASALWCISVSVAVHCNTGRHKAMRLTVACCASDLHQFLFILTSWSQTSRGSASGKGWDHTEVRHKTAKLCGHSGNYVSLPKTASVGFQYSK